MRSAIARITRLAVRFRWITVLITLFIIAAGVFSYTQLNQELIPDIEFPQTFLVAQNGGATSENMLHMYSVPLEERTQDIDGVVNVETTSRDGFAFTTVRNEFGLVQSNVTEDIEEVVASIEADFVPLRRLAPSDGQSLSDFLADLEAEHILWINAYAESQGQGFKQQLLPEVWLSFSPSALQGLPVETFDLLGTELRNDLLARRDPDVETPIETTIEFAYDEQNPPLLPASWQANDPRFRTMADVAELATNRNIATVINDLYEEGYVAGSLRYTSDLTVRDIEKFVAVEAACTNFFNGNPPITDEGLNRCSFMQSLGQSGAIFSMTQETYDALPEDLRNEYPLDNPLTQIEDENGNSYLPNGAVLPQSWRVEAIQVLTFSVSDIPLASLSVSSENLEPDELRQLIENNLIPTLRERDDIAQVVLVGGDLNTQVNGDIPVAPENEDGVPILPGFWPQAAVNLGADETDTADDLLRIPNQSAAQTLNNFAMDPQGQGLVTQLQVNVWRYLAENEEGFYENLSELTLQTMDPVVATALQDEIGREFEISRPLPEEPVARTNGNASLTVTIFKESDVNTVEGWNDVNEFLESWSAENNVDIFVAFEQASFIEESINGVTNDGLLGAVMAIIVILVFMNISVRSTLVTSISIPTSVMMALFIITIVPSNVNNLLTPILEDVGRDSTLGSILEVVVRLFPATFTLNIMSLSGLTVAIGRVVDDSIVVLENIYRNVRQGDDQLSAVLEGTREVSVAILAATLTTMLVFLPLGLFGGITGAFFLPFGLAVTYSLVGSYLVAITTVPALSSLLITKESIIEEVIPVKDSMSTYESTVTRVRNVFIGAIDSLSRGYGRLISFVLRTTFNRVMVIVAAIATLIFGLFLLGQRPQTFLPDFGEPSITVSLSLPSFNDEGRPISFDETDAITRTIENYVLEQSGKGVTAVTASVGGDAQQFDSTTDSVDATSATIRIGLETQEDLDNFLPELRDFTENLMASTFPNAESPEDFVQVSGVSLAGGGFGGFALVIRGATEAVTLNELRLYDADIIETLEGIDGLVNVESSASSDLGSGDTTYIRIDGEPAIQYTGEIEEDDTLGITTSALEAVEDTINRVKSENPEAAAVEVTQGFDSEQQQEGFQQIFVSMAIATLLVYVILALTFGNLMHPVTILVSLPLSVVGAAVALTVTNRVLGLSSLIGLLMLIGIVVTNAVVFLDRVQQNKREKNMPTYDALVEAGTVRLRPILMTAISTTSGVFPLALGLTEGAIIAAELGTVVIGGLVSSTVLTLIVLPVVYSLFDDFIGLIFGRNRGKESVKPVPSPASN